MVNIAIDNIAARFGDRGVLHDVSARFAAGSLSGVIGPNGAGKTTLVRALLGLIPLTGGNISFDGVSLPELSISQRARMLAYLPQSESVHWPITVERLVALGRLPHLAPLARISDHDRAAIEDALDQTDMQDFRHRTATELSGGERARAMLARALAVGGNVLIADEPLASLDPAHQFEVMAIMRKQAEAGRTVVLILHDLAMARRYCDHLLLLDQGRVIADGTPQDVLTPERIAATYNIHVDLIERDGETHLITRS